MNLFQKYGIPGPKPNFFTGNIMEYHEKRTQCIEEWTKKYGKIFGFYLGAKPFLICTDVELLKILQIKDIKRFPNKDWILPDAGIAHKISKYTIGLLRDDEWKNKRAILSTCFSSGKIKMMSSLMTDPIKKFLEKIKEQKEARFDIMKFCKQMTFDVIWTSAFGIVTNVQNNETNLFIESAYAVFEPDSADILGAISVCFPEFEPIPTYLRRVRDAIKWFLKRPSLITVHDTCQKIVNSRKNSEYHPPDLLQTLIDAEDDSLIEKRKLSDGYVIGNALIFMVAGYETTYMTLNWCIYHLVHHPEIQDKVRQEINDNVPANKEIEYTDLVNLQYLDQVISETLRFWPFTPLGVNRKCEEDFQYKDITIPKGAIIAVPVSLIQNDPEYWHQPDKFNPDRFSPVNRGNFDPILYQPFGAGPRMCMGIRLAKTVIRLALANLIKSFKLETCDDNVDIKEIELEFSLFVSIPKNGVNIKAIPLQC